MRAQGQHLKLEQADDAAIDDTYTERLLSYALAASQWYSPPARLGNIGNKRCNPKLPQSLLVVPAVYTFVDDLEQVLTRTLLRLRHPMTRVSSVSAPEPQIATK